MITDNRMMKDIVKVLESCGSIAILPHISADGDGLGSGIAMGLGLQKLGKQAVVYLEENIPLVYSFLPGQEIVRVYDGEHPGYDAVVAVDTGDMGRLGKRAEIFKAAQTTVNIDHHATNDGFAQINLVRTEASAVGEIIHALLREMGVKPDPDISTCLYVAITTDTGGFRYSNTTPLTHEIAADLVRNGVHVAEVSRQVFDTVSLQKVMLMGMAVQSLQLFLNGKTAIITVTEEMMQRAGAKDEDCDGIVNIGRNIRGVEVAVLLRQMKDGEIRVNLRSNAEMDVAAIANAYSGGGHKKAAGCTIQGEIRDIMKKLLKDIEKVMK